MNNSRNLGIDLLRALAMFFVICQHFLGQGELVIRVEGTGKYWILSLLQIISYCAVDIYGITTGYLLCEKKFRLSRLTSIWATTIFWSVAVSCVFFVFVPESRTLREGISMFFPLLRGRYWFFTAYFVVILLSPVLNLLIHNLSRQQFRFLFAALFFIFGVVPVGSLGNDVLRISGGHHFSWMLVLYLIGGYLRKYPLSLTGRKPLCVFFALAALHLAYKLLACLLGFGQWRDLFLTYVSPLILGEAICLFLWFSSSFRSFSENGILGNVVKFVSPGVYAVYVIHVHPLVFWNQDIICLFRSWDSMNGLAVTGMILITALAVFVLCIALDAVRQRLFHILHLDVWAIAFSDRVEHRVRCLLKSGLE